ncbi:hypothetical protein L6452_17052 [Arctium lappa]|uniref:Uncharacterized protein n=1 Tax=Arctium lappa TaxID=4217 RepID=A0ACB9C282_ARCLA|nr:hypothetical protein L6452_17052 [Arctium lappa]
MKEEGRSFAEVVKGSPEQAKERSYEGRKEDKEQENICLTFFPSSDMLARMEKVLIGELKSFSSLSLLGSFNIFEGWSGIKIHYLGGLAVQLEFDTAKDAMVFLSDAESSWKMWFSSMSRWNKDVAINSRLAMLVIQGLPIHVWCSKVFSEIGRMWGEVVLTEEYSNNGISKVYGRVGIITKKMEWIKEIIRIKVDGKIFREETREEVAGAGLSATDNRHVVYESPEVPPVVNIQQPEKSTFEFLSPEERRVFRGKEKITEEDPESYAGYLSMSATKLNASNYVEKLKEAVGQSSEDGSSSNFSYIGPVLHGSKKEADKPSMLDWNRSIEEATIGPDLNHTREQESLLGENNGMKEGTYTILTQNNELFLSTNEPKDNV